MQHLLTLRATLNMTKKPIIAIDADGVMLDYNTAYARAWEKTFGYHPIEINPNAYWASERWKVDHLEGGELERFRASFDEEFWTTVPMLEGVFEACDILHQAGYELVCVTAIDEIHRGYRIQNLMDHGLPIDRVYAAGTAHRTDGLSPKATILADLKPVAFIDDHLPYFKGVHPRIHKALIDRAQGQASNPNQGPDLSMTDSQHMSLLGFSRWWMETAW